MIYISEKQSKYVHVENIELLKLINRIQQELINKGIVVDKVTADLKKLREFFIAEQLPRMVKIVRLAYEHIAKYKTFNILQVLPFQS